MSNLLLSPLWLLFTYINIVPFIFDLMFQVYRYILKGTSKYIYNAILTFGLIVFGIVYYLSNPTRDEMTMMFMIQTLAYIISYKYLETLGNEGKLRNAILLSIVVFAILALFQLYGNIG